MRVLLVPLFPACLVLTACVSTSPTAAGPTDDAAAAGSPCALTSDCVPGAVCAYPIDAGCAAHGVCVTEDLSCTDDGPVVCGCDGTPVGLACIYGPGNAPVPVPSATPGCAPGEAGVD